MQISRLLLVGILGFIMIACPSATLATRVFQQAATAPAQPIPVTGADFGICAGPVIQTINADFEQAVVEQTNQIRMDHGLPPLKHVEALDESARFHAADMSASDYFNHDTLANENGSLVKVCDTWSRIQTYYSDWTALAENIAAGQPTPAVAMAGWMNSPDHRHNILSDNYSEIGVGYYQGSGEYRYYWDQNFGKRNGVFPLVIDGEKAKTNHSTVPVYIYGNFDTMRLRNDQGAWSQWMPFHNSFTWNLTDTPGSHMVTVEMRGTDGNKTSSDTIQLSP